MADGTLIDWVSILPFFLQLLMGVAMLPEPESRTSSQWHFLVPLVSGHAGILSLGLGMGHSTPLFWGWAVGGLALGWVFWTRKNWGSSSDHIPNAKALAELAEKQAQQRTLQDGITLVRQNLEMRKAIRASKRMHLRSQMNPHFLFNVLTGVQHLLIGDQREKAMDIFGRFRHLLLHSMAIRHRVVGSLAEELEHVQQYIELEQQRVSGPFQWHIQCEDDVDPDLTPCPLFLLQPLVENAIWHGLQGGRSTGGEILIRVRWIGHELHLCVHDNGGAGIAERKEESFGKWSSGKTKTPFEREERYASRGLAILKERLSLLRHPGSFSLSAEDSGHPFPQGMTAAIRLPYWKLQDLTDWQNNASSERGWLEGLKPEIRARFDQLNKEARSAARQVEQELQNQKNVDSPPKRE